MSPTERIFELNRTLADQLNAEALANPQSPYAGKFVAIANGQVVAVSPDLDEAMRLLLQAEPDREKIMCFEAGVDYSEVQYIWELR